MADIFLSYTEKDRDEARRIAAVLESVGWTVWWDRRIPAGDTWRNVLERALERMRCMVVLWSTRSIESEWVYEEATEGRRQGKLVPVLIEAVRPPAGFREIQAADLTHWDGSLEFEGMRLLIADLERLLGKPDTRGGPSLEDPLRPGDSAPAYDPADQVGGKAVPGRRPRPARLVAAIAAAVLLASGVVYVLRPAPAPGGGSLAGPTSSQAEPPTQVPPVVAAPPPAPARVDPLPPAPSVPARPAPVVVGAIATTKERTPAVRVDRASARTSRCADLVARIQLGESLSDETRRFFQKECRQ